MNKKYLKAICVGVGVLGVSIVGVGIFKWSQRVARKKLIEERKKHDRVLSKFKEERDENARMSANFKEEQKRDDSIQSRMRAEFISSWEENTRIHMRDSFSGRKLFSREEYVKLSREGLSYNLALPIIKARWSALSPEAKFDWNKKAGELKMKRVVHGLKSRQ